MVGKGGEARTPGEHLDDALARLFKALPGGEALDGLLHHVGAAVVGERLVQKHDGLIPAAERVERIGDAADDERQVGGRALHDAVPAAQGTFGVAERERDGASGNARTRRLGGTFQAHDERGRRASSKSLRRTASSASSQ